VISDDARQQERDPDEHATNGRIVSSVGPCLGSGSGASAGRRLTATRRYRPIRASGCGTAWSRPPRRCRGRAGRSSGDLVARTQGQVSTRRGAACCRSGQRRREPGRRRTRRREQHARSSARLRSEARDQRAGGGQPAGDRRALSPTGHPLGAGDQLCQPAPIARRPRGAGRPCRVQRRQRGERSGSCWSCERDRQTDKGSSESEPHSVTHRPGVTVSWRMALATSYLRRFRKTAEPPQV
jgi:hypothetical protein